MLNNMKAMYAHPWGRPGNFETLKNSHVYPQMFNNLDGSMWKYEEENPVIWEARAYASNPLNCKLVT